MAMPKGVYERQKGPGLRRMIAATPPGLCPFCLDPLAAEHRYKGRELWGTCGDEVCKKAWWRCYTRDRRGNGR